MRRAIITIAAVILAGGTGPEVALGKTLCGDENDIYGMHAKMSNFGFVRQWMVDTRNDLELGVIILAEWQHDPAGADMDEGPAQAQFEVI
jgi:hypothetical protein